MTNPTDTNQASEDELRAEILTEFKQVHKLAPADYTENCTNIVMSIIRTEKLKLLAEVRESMKSNLHDMVVMERENYTPAAQSYALKRMQEINNSLIKMEAEL